MLAAIALRNPRVYFYNNSSFEPIKFFSASLRIHMDRENQSTHFHSIQHLINIAIKIGTVRELKG